MNTDEGKVFAEMVHRIAVRHADVRGPLIPILHDRHADNQQAASPQGRKPRQREVTKGRG